MKYSLAYVSMIGLKECFDRDLSFLNPILSYKIIRNFL